MTPWCPLYFLFFFFPSPLLFFVNMLQPQKNSQPRNDQALTCNFLVTLLRWRSFNQNRNCFSLFFSFFFFFFFVQWFYERIVTKWNVKMEWFSGREYSAIYPKTIPQIDGHGSFGEVLIADRSNALYFICTTGSITRRNVHRGINERPMTNFVDIACRGDSDRSKRSVPLISNNRETHRVETRTCIETRFSLSCLSKRTSKRVAEYKKGTV